MDYLIHFLLQDCLVRYYQSTGHGQLMDESMLLLTYLFFLRLFIGFLLSLNLVIFHLLESFCLLLES